MFVNADTGENSLNLTLMSLINDNKMAFVNPSNEPKNIDKRTSLNSSYMLLYLYIELNNGLPHEREG